MYPSVDNVTMAQLTELVEKNKEQAEALGLQLTFKFEAGKLIGRVRNGKYIPYEKEYIHPQVHINWVHMQEGFAAYLDDQVLFKRRHLEMMLRTKHDQYLSEKLKAREEKETADVFWRLTREPGTRIAFNYRHLTLMRKGVPYGYHMNNCYFSTSGISEVYPYASFPKEKVNKIEIKGVMQDAILPNDIEEMTATEREEAFPSSPPEDW